MLDHDKKNRVYGLLITIIWPFWGLIYSIKNRYREFSVDIFFVVCIYLGFIHIFNPIGGSGADGLVYATKLGVVYNSHVTFSEFFRLFSQDEGAFDIYQPLLTFIVSLFTNDAHYLFVCFAVVFGYFYSKNIWYVINRISPDSDIYIFIFIVFYILICPVSNINGVRMWTALHVFVYGLLPYLYENDTRKLYWMPLSLLFHFSFVLPLGIFIAYNFLPKRLSFFFIFYLITLFVKEVDLALVRLILHNYLPDIFFNRVESYTSEEYAQNINSVEYSWHVYLAKNISYWIVQIFIVISYFVMRLRNDDDSRLNALFGFSLFIYGISNVLSYIPSAHRYIVISQMFMIPFFIFCIDRYGDSALIRKGKYFLLLLLFSIVFNIRSMLDYYGVSLVFGNFFTAFFYDDRIPIIDFVKKVF